MSALNCLIFARRKTQFELVQEGKSFKDPIAKMKRRQDAIKRCFQGCREEEIPERYKLPRIHTHTHTVRDWNSISRKQSRHFTYEISILNFFKLVFGVFFVFF